MGNKGTNFLVPNSTLFLFLRLSQRLDAGRPHFAPTVMVLDERCMYPRVRHTLFTCLKNKCQSGPLAHNHLESQAELTVFAVYDTVCIQTPPQRNLHHYQGHSLCTALVSFLISTHVCVCARARTYTPSLRPQLSPYDKDRLSTSALQKTREKCKWAPRIWMKIGSSWNRPGGLSRPLSLYCCFSCSRYCPSCTRYILPLYPCFRMSSIPQSRIPAHLF